MSSTQIAVVNRQSLIATLGASHYPNSSPASIELVLSYCEAANLDPMLKPVHIVPMWDNNLRQYRDVIMPGVGLYRIQASRSGSLAGIDEPEFGPMVTQNIGGHEVTYPEWCKVTVRREMTSGKVATFTAVEYWLENYAVKGGKEKSIAPNAMWAKRPRGQLAKCAQAQALRAAFPEVGQAPTAEEMEGKTITEEVVTVNGSPDPTPNAQPPSMPAYPDDKFTKNLPAWEKSMQSGRLSPGDVIARIQSAYTLTDAQIKTIYGLDVVEAEFTDQGNQP